MWSLPYVTSMIDIFVFTCADHETQDYYCFAKQPTRKNSPDYPENKKLNCLRTIY